MARIVRFAVATVACGVALSLLVVLALRFIPPPTTAYMIEARLAALLTGERAFRIDYQWVDWGRISPNAAVAVVAAEDQLFPVHWGFDFRAIDRALASNSRDKRVRGASTISQQVAKNLFLWSGRTWLRKGMEAYATVLLEALWPKRRILEVYLNIAEFGPGIYGVEAASQRYFKKPAVQLTAFESARLAAVLPRPLQMHVDRPSRYVAARTEHILAEMIHLGSERYLHGL